MGCTPQKVKHTQMPPNNAYPAASRMPNPIVPAEQPTPSRMTAQDYNEMMRNDIYVKDEQPTPRGVESIDFLNKKYIPPY